MLLKNIFIGLVNLLLNLKTKYDNEDAKSISINDELQVKTSLLSTIIKTMKDEINNAIEGTSINSGNDSYLTNNLKYIRNQYQPRIELLNSEIKILEQDLQNINLVKNFILSQIDFINLEKTKREGKKKQIAMSKNCFCKILLKYSYDLSSSAIIIRMHKHVKINTIY